MPLFKQKQAWEQTFRVRSHAGASKGFCAVLFWFWGIVGLLFNVGTLFGLTGGMGVREPAYLTSTCLVWIGGMMLFGLGAMLSQGDFDGEQPIDNSVGDVRITR